MLKTIETSLNVEGFNAEIEIEESVLNKLAVFLGQDEEGAYEELEHEVSILLDELDSQEKLQAGNEFNEEITIAVEDKRDVSTYDSITFDLSLSVDEFNDVKGSIVNK